MTDTPLLNFWHGARKWQDPPQLKAGRKSRYEHGVGIYLTNTLQRAISYSKGGGSLVLFGIDPSVRLLENTSASMEEIQEGLDTLPRLRNRHTIESFLTSVAQERFFNGNIPLQYVLNELINTENLGGAKGIEFSQWLVHKGVDATVHKVSAQENWMVVFNPAVVKTSKVFGKATAHHIGDFPPLCPPKKLGM